MATLWWSAPNVTYSILQKFTILYTLKIHLPSKPTVWNDPSLYESLDVSGTEKMGVVNGLEQDMVYVFRVQYEADEVMSNLSTISQAKTLSSEDLKQLCINVMNHPLYQMYHSLS